MVNYEDLGLELKEIIHGSPEEFHEYYHDINGIDETISIYLHKYRYIDGKYENIKEYNKLIYSSDDNPKNKSIDIDKYNDMMLIS